MDRIAIINPDATEEIRGNLIKRGIEPVPIPKTVLVQGPLSGHPDLQVFVCGRRVFCHPDIDRAFRAKVDRHAETVACSTRLSMDYPGDIPYNIAFTGSHAFHHCAVIDPAIREFLLERGVALSGVSQGYAKCSTLVAGERAIITSDASIHAAARAAGLEPLLVRPGYIDLPGYDYGFIGGAAGLAGDMVLLTGTLTHHPDYESIEDFIVTRGKRIEPLSRMKAVDLGTIFVL
jgi:hypothetical protein